MCSDPDRLWYAQRLVCYASMEQRAAQNRYQRLHEEKPWHDGKFSKWSAEPSAATPYHFMDGVSIIVTDTDLQPDDNFLDQQR